MESYPCFMFVLPDLNKGRAEEGLISPSVSRTILKLTGFELVKEHSH